MKPCVSVICKPQDGNTLLIKENTDKVSIFLCFAYLGPIIFFLILIPYYHGIPRDTATAVFL